MAYKENFLNQYNVERSEETAARRAIDAALQRNRTYCSEEDQHLRPAFRLIWRQRLNDVAREDALYAAPADTYKIIQDFRDSMRVEIARGISDGRLPRLNFRISHAQKSISVYLKHLWCMNRVPMPSTCPVDHRIMTAAQAPHIFRAWGFVDDIQHHEKQIGFLLECARNTKMPLAKWELQTFVG